METGMEMILMILLEMLMMEMMEVIKEEDEKKKIMMETMRLRHDASTEGSFHPLYA